MAFTPRHNVTSNTIQTLVAEGDNAGNIKSINIANTHSSTSNSVDLFVLNSGKSYYIMKNVEIPAGVSLIVDTKDITINTKVNGGDNLRIKIDNTTAGIDVIINT